MIQRAGIAALRGDQTFLEDARARFQRRRDLFVRRSGNKIGFSIPKPTATFYVWGSSRARSRRVFSHGASGPGRRRR